MSATLWILIARAHIQQVRFLEALCCYRTQYTFISKKHEALALFAKIDGACLTATRLSGVTRKLENAYP
jgi:hypothetical protein